MATSKSFPTNHVLQKKKLPWNIARQPTRFSKLHHITILDLIRLFSLALSREQPLPFAIPHGDGFLHSSLKDLDTPLSLNPSSSGGSSALCYLLVQLPWGWIGFYLQIRDVCNFRSFEKETEHFSFEWGYWECILLGTYPAFLSSFPPGHHLV